MTIQVQCPRGHVFYLVDSYENIPDGILGCPTCHMLSILIEQIEYLRKALDKFIVANGRINWNETAQAFHDFAKVYSEATNDESKKDS